jgi:tRNA(Ile)-lysidine synthase
MDAGLVDRFEAGLDRHPRLIPEGSTVLVSLSGGPDSMALLHLLTRVRDRRRLHLAAAHFDHKVRPESTGQARLVAERSAELGVPCAIGQADSRMTPTQAGFREARYAYLDGEADRLGADRIATGHQADDQVETVLFRMCRGTGLRGLAGIPARRGRIVRPLLPFWRSELLEYLEARQLPWLDDSSNRDDRWARARIRHGVIPALEEVGGPGVSRRLISLAAAAGRADRALDSAARAALNGARAMVATSGPVHGLRPRVLLDREALNRLEPEVLARAVRLAARRSGFQLTAGATRDAVAFVERGRSGTAIDVASGLRLGREFHVLWLGPPDEYQPDRQLEISAVDAGDSRVPIGGREYRVAWSFASLSGGAERPTSGERSPSPGWRVALPVPGLEFPLQIRGPRPGDRIRLAGGSRKLKKLLGERRVPRGERPRMPVLTDAAGDVLWVAGVATARMIRESPEGLFLDLEVTECPR